MHSFDMGFEPGKEVGYDEGYNEGREEAEQAFWENIKPGIITIAPSAPCPRKRLWS